MLQSQMISTEASSSVTSAQTLCSV